MATLYRSFVGYNGGHCSDFNEALAKGWTYLQIALSCVDFGQWDGTSFPRLDSFWKWVEQHAANYEEFRADLESKMLRTPGLHDTSGSGRCALDQRQYFRRDPHYHPVKTFVMMREYKGFDHITDADLTDCILGREDIYALHDSRSYHYRTSAGDFVYKWEWQACDTERAICNCLRNFGFKCIQCDEVEKLDVNYPKRLFEYIKAGTCAVCKGVIAEEQRQQERARAQADRQIADERRSFHERELHDEQLQVHMKSQRKLKRKLERASYQVLEELGLLDRAKELLNNDDAT